MTTNDIELCSICFKMKNGDVLATSTGNTVLLATIASMCEFVRVDPDHVTFGKLHINKKE